MRHVGRVYTRCRHGCGDTLQVRGNTIKTGAGTLLAPSRPTAHTDAQQAAGQGRPKELDTGTPPDTAQGSSRDCSETKDGTSGDAQGTVDATECNTHRLIARRQGQGRRTRRRRTTRTRRRHRKKNNSARKRKEKNSGPCCPARKAGLSFSCLWEWLQPRSAFPTQKSRPKPPHLTRRRSG